MVKTHTPEQEAISRAKKMPDRKWFVGWRMAWGWGNWPFKWSFFTNWTGFTIALWEPAKKFHGPEVPENKFVFTIATRPFSLMCFWEQKRILWIGDWEWKKELKRNEED